MDLFDNLCQVAENAYFESLDQINDDVSEMKSKLYRFGGAADSLGDESTGSETESEHDTYE